MESLSSETKGIALDILEDILSAIEKVEERTKDVNSIEKYKNIRRDIPKVPRRFVSVTVSRIVIASPGDNRKLYNKHSINKKRLRQPLTVTGMV